jgi:hypothetical protein
MRSLLVSALLLVFLVTALAADEAPSNDAKSEAKGEAKNLLKPTNEVESWVFELNDEGQGEMSVADDAIVFKTTKTTGTDWHVQAYQTELDLEEGKDYIVKFQMKSPDKVALLLLGLINEDDWHEIGLHEEVQPGEEYKEFEYEFTATDVVDGNNRIGFVLGIDEGEVSVKDMTLAEKQ